MKIKCQSAELNELRVENARYAGLVAAISTSLGLPGETDKDRFRGLTEWFDRHRSFDRVALQKKMSQRQEPF